MHQRLQRRWPRWWEGEGEDNRVWCINIIRRRRRSRIYDRSSRGRRSSRRSRSRVCRRSRRRSSRRSSSRSRWSSSRNRGSRICSRRSRSSSRRKRSPCEHQSLRGTRKVHADVTRPIWHPGCRWESRFRRKFKVRLRRSRSIRTQLLRRMLQLRHDLWKVNARMRLSLVSHYSLTCPSLVSHLSFTLSLTCLSLVPH